MEGVVGFGWLVQVLFDGLTRLSFLEQDKGSEYRAVSETCCNRLKHV